MLVDQSGFDEPLTPGSRLELTGVYVGQGGNRVLGRPIDSFQLLLNSGDDVRVLSRPPWWTLKRLMLVVGLLIGVLVGRSGLDQAAASESRAAHAAVGGSNPAAPARRTQRNIEQERARLAHDLHDDLGAGLTEVNMLASLIKSPGSSEDEKTRYAG